MRNVIIFLVFCFVSVLCLFSLHHKVKAQDSGVISVETLVVDGGEEEKPLAPEQEQPAPFDVEQIPSLFFTYWQHEAILNAKSSRGGAVRAPTEGELDNLDFEDNIEVSPPPREVSLGGIVYDGADDWTIWINNVRVTPDAVPEEVLDLRVFKDYIEIKWIDTKTNQVFPIRLRAHQRFNLDMRVFLTGE